MRQPVPRVFFHALNLFFVDWLPQNFRRETQNEVSYRHELFYGWILAVLDVCEAQHWRQHNLHVPFAFVFKSRIDFRASWICDAHRDFFPSFS